MRQITSTLIINDPSLLLLVRISPTGFLVTYSRYVIIAAEKLWSKVSLFLMISGTSHSYYPLATFLGFRCLSINTPSLVSIGFSHTW